jgi:hypothetical protein
MKTHPIIADLDVAGNVFACLLPRRVGGPVHTLDFQRSIERLSEGIIEADAGAPDGLPDPQPSQDGSELGRRIIAASVAVKPNSV